MTVELLELPEGTELESPQLVARNTRPPRATKRSAIWMHVGALSTCVLFALVLFWPTVGFDFLNWDDPWYVLENPLILSWHPANLYRIATEVAIKNFAPLTVLSFLVDHTIWGLDATGFHLTNVLLHALNAALVYVLIVRLTRSRCIAWATAALFAVHPLQVETVAWVSSRKGLLSGAFTLACLICWLRPERDAKHEGWGLLFYVAALLSKALAIVVPPVVLLYDVFVRRQTWSTAIARQIVPGVMAILLLLITMTAQSTEVGGIRGHMELSKLHIFAVDTVILWKYVGMLLVPRNLCVLYDQPTSGIAGAIAISTLGWLAVAVILVCYRKQYPLAVLGVASFFLFLFPVLNFFPITTLMNDRYLYLPSIPVFALVAVSIRWLASEFVKATSNKISRSSIYWRNAFAVSAAMGLVLLYADETRAYLPVWKDGMSLWRDASAKAGQLTVVQIQLANSFHAAGDDEQAIRILEEALNESQPDELDRKRIEEKMKAWSTE